MVRSDHIPTYIITIRIYLGCLSTSKAAGKADVESNLINNSIFNLFFKQISYGRIKRLENDTSHLPKAAVKVKICFIWNKKRL